MKRGYLYIKLSLKAIPSAANSTRSFSLSNIEGIEQYNAVKPINKSGRSVPSVLDGLYKVKVNDDADIPSLCAKLSKEPNVIYAEPIVEFPLLYTPSDPNASDGNQSYLSVIKAFEAWDVTKGDDLHVIGIIDSGLDFNHDDIISKIFINSADIPNGIDDDGNGYIDDYRGYDFSSNDTSAQCIRSFHGNRVGGLAGADTDNAFGIAGMGFNAKIAALKAYNENTNLIDAGYEAILYAAEMGFDVVNLSYGSPYAYSQAGQDLINYAVMEKNMVVVAAAGNSNKNEPYYPASFQNVLSVAATSVDDVKSSFSTYSPLVDLVAPGTSIYSTFKLNGFASDNGTSYSSPLVAGTAALVKAAFPNYNALQIMEQIRVTTDDIYDKNPSYEGLLGSGRLNAYRAVSETNTQSARMENMTFSATNGKLIYASDTVTIAFDVTNYLLLIQNLKLSFSSQSPYVDFLEPEISFGNLATLTTQSYTSKFLKITEDLPSETNILIKVSLTGTGYSDVQYFEISAGPKSYLFDNGHMAMMLRDDGAINSSTGLSSNFDLKWKDESVAITQGIFVSKDETMVADNLVDEIGQYTFSNDFSARQTFEIKDGVFSDFQISTSFEETTQNGIGIAIEQSTISNASEDFLVQTYRLANQTSDSLKNLSFGYYTDWYLRTFTQNRAYFDSSSQILMAFDKDSTLYAGIKVIGDVKPRYHALDIDSLNGNQMDTQAALDDDLLFALSQLEPFDSAGQLGDGNDIASLAIADSINLGPKASKSVAFLLAIADNKAELISKMSQAETLYSSYLANIPIMETFYSCKGASVYVNPSSGSSYRFYSDYLGEQLIATSDSLLVSNIIGDTTFFVKNMDGDYEGKLERVDVILKDFVADFIVDKDTAYLENNIALITFTDMSFEPISWLWDFGNGSQTSQQSPSVYFTQTGNYTVKLTIQSKSGCIDSFSKKVVIAKRPADPIILDSYVCYGDSIRVFSPYADSIALYSGIDNTQPFAIGRAVWIRNITTDTVLYAKNITGPFESEKYPFRIYVNEPKASFSYAPDTLSSSIGAVFTNNDYLNTSSKWYIDSELISTLDTFYTAVSSETLSISLEVINEQGCKDSVHQNLLFKQSPLPTLVFEQPCQNEALKLEPQNGTIFGLFANENLTQSIQKGRSLTIEEGILDKATTVYLVGLDSILPSQVLPINIQPIEFSFEIIASHDTLYLDETNSLELSSSITLSKYEWFVDNQLVEIISNPTLFFNATGTYEIKLTGKDEHGCSASDTYNVRVLNTRILPGLLAVERDFIEIYPNPTHGEVALSTIGVEKIYLTNLSGAEVGNYEVNVDRIELQLGHLPKGVYILQLHFHEGAIKSQKLILQ